LLDFATGTGTFLLETLKQIFASLPAGSGRKQLLIKDHILKNFYGFECLIAPYTIAHIKLSQFLKDNGYTMGDEERLQIYLTNTLDPTDEKHPNFLLPSLSEEGKSANKIREKPILVITGNPPYNVKSKNKGEWIKKQLQVYKQGLTETKINLDDDYIKFIRFAEYKIEKQKEGIVAIITNNSFYSGTTHRLMRKSLLSSFDEIYILNLHGNIQKTVPDGIKDENVFDITQGVGITIFIKKPARNESVKVYYADLRGKREEKYKYLLEKNKTEINWTELPPPSSLFIFLSLKT